MALSIQSDEEWFAVQRLLHSMRTDKPKEPFAAPAGSVMPCPFCGSPVENGYLQVRKRPQQEGHLVNMVVCLSCAASAPMGMWNTREPNMKGEAGDE